MRKILKFEALVVCLVLTLSVCAFFTFRNFSEDQRHLASHLNQKLLQSVRSRIPTELKTRLVELELFIPRVYSAKPNLAHKKDDLFADLRPQLRNEVAGVTFFRRVEGKTEAFRQYRNKRTFKKLHVDSESLAAVFHARPIPFNEFYTNKKLILMNRSVLSSGTKGEVELNFITLVMDGRFLQGAPQDTVIVVDLVPDFLRADLRESETAEAFLVFGDGKVFCHDDPKTTREYSERPLPHPILDRIKNGSPTREAQEMSLPGGVYYVSAAETGFENLLAVAQIKKGTPFSFCEPSWARARLWPWPRRCSFCFSPLPSVRFCGEVPRLPRKSRPRSRASPLPLPRQPRARRRTSLSGPSKVGYSSFFQGLSLLPLWRAVGKRKRTSSFTWVR